MTGVTLPWPPKELSPNARKDRRAISGIRKTYRETCGWLAKKERLDFAHLDSIHLRITFHPPDERRRDLDNMLAAIKSGLDGVSDAVRVDDSKWALTIRKGAPVRPHGAVLVEVVPADQSPALTGHWRQIGDVARDMVRGTVK